MPRPVPPAHAARVTLGLMFSLVCGASAQAQTVVDILPAPSSGAWGLEFIDGFLYVGDDSDGFIFKVDPADGSVLETLPTPYDTDHIAFGANHGVTFDGTHLWVAGDFNKDWIYELDLTGATLDSIPTPTDAVGGLSWDGTNLLVTSYFPNAEAGILIVDPSDGTVLGSTIPTQGTQPFGIAYDTSDGSVWNGMDDNDGDSEDIWNLAVPSGAVSSSFPTPAQSPKGIALGDGFMWVVANTIGGAGRRIYKIDLGGAGTPDVTAIPTSRDFGIVATGATGQASQTLRNDGDGDLTITSIATALPFSHDAAGFPIVVAPAGEVVFDVFFDPTVAGDFQDVLTVESDDIDEGSLEIPLSGTGVPPDATVAVSPGALSFDDTGVGLVRDLTLTIENVGLANLAVTNVVSDMAAFELVVPALPAVLGTFETLAVQVVFRPDATVSYPGTITVSSTDGDDPMVDVPVGGEGVIKTFAPGEVVWSAQGIENVVSVLRIPDVTGDGVDDALMETYDAGADGDPFLGFHGNSDTDGVSLYATGEGMSGGWGDQCLALSDDLDMDGFAEVLRGVAWGGRRVEVRGTEDAELLWSYDTQVDDGGGWVYAVATLPDVSGDGLPEVLAAAGTDGGAGTGARRVYCFDGATGGIRFEHVGIDAFQCVTAIEDVNGDMVPDVVAGAGGNSADDRVYCLSGASVGAASVLWDFPTGGSVFSVAVIADVDDDGVDDVLAGSWSNVVYCISGATGGELWSSGIGGDVLRVEAIDDVTGDGVQDVVVAAILSSFRLLDGASGVLEWFVPTGDNVWSITSIDDVNEDGVRDVIAGSQDDNVYCVDGTDGGILWTQNLGALVFSVRAISDVNGSGYADVIAGTQYLNGVGGQMFCLEGNGVIVSAGEPDATPSPLGFLGVAPNPLRGPGVFRFEGAVGEAAVEIFDVSGRLVRRLDSGGRRGVSQIRWDGRSALGADAAGGVYFYRVTASAIDGRPIEQVNGKLTVVR